VESVSDPNPEPTTDERSEFDKFKDLAKKLVHVPKHETDKADRDKS
jgi:hypothetical protein